MASSLYIIGPETGKVKIGITKNVKQRLRQLQTGHPEHLEVHQTFQCDSWDSARILESAIHQRLRSVRETGEWFNIDADTAYRLIDTMLTVGPLQPFLSEDTENRLAELSQKLTDCFDRGSELRTKYTRLKEETEQAHQELLANYSEYSTIQSEMKLCSF